MDRKSLLIGIGIGAFIGLNFRSITSYFMSKPKKTEADGPFNEETINYESEEYKSIVSEQYIRNIQFLGSEGHEKVTNSYVLIVGVGGVGSHAVLSLARAGVKSLKIIDFDQISLSSLNRHAFATRDEVGLSKVRATRDFIKKICPHIKVEIIEGFLAPDNIETIINDNPDFVLDCIDNIDAKCSLVAFCHRRKIPVISCCGAGMKADPTRLQIRDISEAKYDDLARALRTKLKKRFGITTGVTILYSMEKTEKNLLPLKEHQTEKPEDYRIMKNYRLRIVPVLGTMPAIMGYAMSSYVLCYLANQPYKPYEVDDVKHTNYVRLYNILLAKEKALGVQPHEVDFDIEDMYIMARMVCDWKCVLTGKKYQTLETVKWNPAKKADVYNIVLMNNIDAKKHQNIKKLEDLYTEAQIKQVNDLLAKVPLILAKKEQIFL